MVAIALRFPAGRFHATPWGRHVNEGAPEWPPSPWRMLRSLIAVWKIKVGSIPESEIRSVIGPLLEPPQFCLPAATTGHTRHYMPLGLKRTDGAYVQETTKVFDAFVCLDRESEVIAIWPQAQLNPRGRATLADLLDNLGYLGRAESWCDARLLPIDTALPRESNSRPLGENTPSRNEETIRVICPDPKTALDDKHVKALKQRRKYDPSWHLAIETGQLHDERWSDPPGSRWVTYVRPADCFHPHRRPARLTTPERPRMQVARYALDSSVLPLATRTLPLAEQARRALMFLQGQATESSGRRGRSSVLSGKDEDGCPLLGHRHAYYLPTDEDGDGRLDHLTVVAEQGFDSSELNAFDRLSYLRISDEMPHIRVLLLGLGRLDQFDVPPLRRCATWVSASPFLVTRHPKRTGSKQDSPQMLADAGHFTAQVLREEIVRLVERRSPSWNVGDVLIRALFDEPGVFQVNPKLWAPDAQGPVRRPMEFKRFRQKRSDDGGRRRSGTFAITFPEKVRGPIALGHSSHFGMGLFLPSFEGN